MVEVCRAGLGPLRGIDRITLHHRGAVGGGVFDGGGKQRPGHAGPAVAGGDDETTDGPHLVPAGIPGGVRAADASTFERRILG